MAATVAAEGDRAGGRRGPQRVDPAEDADGLHPTNLGRLVLSIPAAPPCTAWAQHYPRLVVGNIERAPAAFARVRFGLAPTTSHLDECTVVMANGNGDGLLPEGASNLNIDPFTAR